MLLFHLGFYYGILIHSLEFPSFPSRKVFESFAQITDPSSDDLRDKSTDYHSEAFADEYVAIFMLNCHTKPRLDLA
jgi:hypothetical protein